MLKENLSEFLLEANRHFSKLQQEEDIPCYRNPDGSLANSFTKDDWRLSSRIYGEQSQCQQIIISNKDKPYWFMSYRGDLANKEISPVFIYPFLNNGLKQMPPEFPIRGPKKYEENQIVYTHNWKGDLDNFSGEETITSRGFPVYSSVYLGGFIK
jgi:hypothetical protein